MSEQAETDVATAAENALTKIEAYHTADGDGLTHLKCTECDEDIVSPMPKASLWDMYLAAITHIPICGGPSDA